MRYIASCSFGKDSIATILIALEKGEPLTDIIFAEVMFDHERGISGEHPEHIEWVYNQAIPKLRELTNGAVRIHVLRSKKDYLQLFHHKPKGKYFPRKQGFVIGGKCVANRELKLAPIKKFYKELQEPCITYIGIAADEPKRYDRIALKRDKFSLLVKYGITEADARNICLTYDLLSPIYSTAKRNGCWFCPNCSVWAFAELYKKHPLLWGCLQEMAATPKESLISVNFKYTQSFTDIERRVERIVQAEKTKQLTLFG